MEIMVSVGEYIEEDQPVAKVNLNYDVYQMPNFEVCLPLSGIVRSLNVKVGDMLSLGDLILKIEIDEKTKNKILEPYTSPAFGGEIITEKWVDVGDIVFFDQPLVNDGDDIIKCPFPKGKVIYIAEVGEKLKFLDPVVKIDMDMETCKSVFSAAGIDLPDALFVT